MLSVDEVARRLLSGIKERFGLPPGAPAYILWGVSPKELQEIILRFLEEDHLTTEQKRFVKRLLPKVKAEEMNLVVLVPVGERVYIRGTRVQAVLPLEG